MALDYNSITTKAELIAAINANFGTPKRPPVTGQDTNVILRKIVELTTHETKTYANIAARDAETGDWPDFAFVVDATGDPTVDAGAALYYNNNQEWTKVVETADLDLVLHWANIQDKPNLQFSSDITVKLNGNKFGKYGNGDVINATNKTANEVLLDALTEVIHPVYVTPQAFILSSPVPSDIETGTTMNVLLDTAYTQNDGGSSTGLTIKRNGSTIASSDPYTDAGFGVTLTPTEYQAFYTYNQGPLKQNNMGENDGTGRINAGTVASNIITFQGYRKMFFGPADAVPANSNDVRDLLQSLLTNGNNLLVLNTGIDDKIFAFALPEGKALLRVVDIDASSNDITLEYSSSSISVEDVGGNASDYTLYVKQQDVEYLINHRHQIYLSDE